MSVSISRASVGKAAGRDCKRALVPNLWFKIIVKLKVRRGSRQGDWDDAPPKYVYLLAFLFYLFNRRLRAFSFLPVVSLIALWYWTSASEWAMRTVVQKIRWVWQHDCLSFPTAREQTLQKSVSPTICLVLISCSQLHSYLIAVSDNWGQLFVCLLFNLVMIMLHHISALCRWLLPAGQELLGSQGALRAVLSARSRAAGTAPGMGPSRGWGWAKMGAGCQPMAAQVWCGAAVLAWSGPWGHCRVRGGSRGQQCLQVPPGLWHTVVLVNKWPWCADSGVHIYMRRRVLC